MWLDIPVAVGPVLSSSNEKAKTEGLFAALLALPCGLTVS